MNIKRARQIAVRLMANKFANQANVDDTDDKVGEFALGLVKDYSLKHNWRFDGLRSEMGRLSQAISVPQTELHEFFIEYILPYILAEGLTATGHITFAWSGNK
jgi:hypothetical protein